MNMKTSYSTLLAIALTASPILGQTLISEGNDSLSISDSVALSLTEFDEVVPTIDPLTPTLADEQLLVDLYLKLKDFTEAGAAADKILAKHPRDPIAIGAKATIALQQQDVIASLRWAEKFRSVQPGPEADLTLAGAYRLARRFDDALALLEKLKKQSPKNEAFPHLIEFGYTYYDARQFDKARAVFQLVRNDLRYLPQQRTEATKQIGNLNRERAITAAYRAFNRFLAELPHSGIVTNTIAHGRRSILFLFPANSDPELTTKFSTAFQNFTSQIGLNKSEAPTFHLTTPDDSPQQLWGKLLLHGGHGWVGGSLLCDSGSPKGA